MEQGTFGRYRLLELIGEGGMGQVFKAHDTVIGRDVAIKVLPPEMATLAGYRDRFRREAQIAARLTEPHIIPIHDTGEIDGRLYLVMPIIEGIDVHTVLAREGPMSPPKAVRVIQQLAAALNAAHRNGLVHRDIKPSNALITPDEHVYLIDFGIAHDSSATRLTQTGMMVGTFSYMAPERFVAGTVDARADVYALTCVLHECLTGTTPFPGDSMEQQIAAHLTMEPPKPSVSNARVPVGFNEVIARGMAKQPGNRYQTAGELSAAAQNALTAAPPPPRPAWPPMPPPPVRQPPPMPPPLQPVSRPVRPPLRPPMAPTMPPTQQSADRPTVQAATLLATPQPEPTIGVGRFACSLFGVVVMSLLVARLLIPWWAGPWVPSAHDRIPSILTYLGILGLIPGIVLLVGGRGRSRADHTIRGCALVALGLGTLFWRLFYSDIPVGFLWLLLGLGFVLLAISTFPGTTGALARGYLSCGVGVATLALVEFLLLPFVSALDSWHVLYGAASGALWLSAGAIANRRTGPDSSPPRPLGIGEFACVLGGVVLVAMAVAGLIGSWWYEIASGSRLILLGMLAAIPGIVLLALGRGRAHIDQTITGSGLVVLAIATELLLRLGLPSLIYLISAVAGLALLLVALFRRPSRALARGYLTCGAGILALVAIDWIYRITHMAGFYIYTSDPTFLTAIGVLLLTTGLIAWLLARRTEATPAGPLPAAPPRR